MFPRHPGYVMMVCAEASTALATQRSADGSMLAIVYKRRKYVVYFRGGGIDDVAMLSQKRRVSLSEIPKFAGSQIVLLLVESACRSLLAARCAHKRRPGKPRFLSRISNARCSSSIRWCPCQRDVAASSILYLSEDGVGSDVTISWGCRSWPRLRKKKKQRVQGEKAEGSRRGNIWWPRRCSHSACLSSRPAQSNLTNIGTLWPPDGVNPAQ